jgi:hypothetical protein
MTTERNLIEKLKELVQNFKDWGRIKSIHDEETANKIAKRAVELESEISALEKELAEQKGETGMSIEILGLTFYSELYLKSMMEREYQRGKKEGQSIHILEYRQAGIRESLINFRKYFNSYRDDQIDESDIDGFIDEYLK